MPTNSEQKDQQRPESSDWLDRFEHLNLHFGRYLRDVAGLLLIAIALMSLLALWGVTSGILLNPWSEFLSKWFGWGSYIIALAIGYGGLVLLRRNGKPLGLIRILSLELAAFLTLGLLAVIGSDSICPRGSRAGWRASGLGDRLFAGQVCRINLGRVDFICIVASDGHHRIRLMGVFEVWLLKLAGEPVTPPPLPVQKEVVAESSEGRTACKACAQKEEIYSTSARISTVVESR